jgi:hypothetical protein
MHHAVSMHVHLHFSTMYTLCIQHRDISGAIINKKSTFVCTRARYTLIDTRHICFTIPSTYPSRLLRSNSHGLLVDVMDWLLSSLLAPSLGRSHVLMWPEWKKVSDPLPYQFHQMVEFNRKKNAVVGPCATMSGCSCAWRDARDKPYRNIMWNVR